LFIIFKNNFGQIEGKCINKMCVKFEENRLSSFFSILHANIENDVSRKTRLKFRVVER